MHVRRQGAFQYRLGVVAAEAEHDISYGRRVTGPVCHASERLIVATVGHLLVQRVVLNG